MKGSETLAKVVVDRRSQLDLTQADVAERGGPSTETLRLIENAKQEKFGERTLFRLDRALQWPDGTAQKIVRGELQDPPVDDAGDVFGLADTATTSLIIPCGTGHHLVTVRGEIVRVDHFT